jgi:hypothetical protein
MAQFHLDQLNSFFDAPAHAASPRSRRRISVHEKRPLLVTNCR